MPSIVDIIISTVDRTADGIRGADHSLRGLGTVAAAAGAGAGTALIAGFAANASINAETDKLGAQLGLTAQDADKAGQVAGAVYRDAWGGSLEEVNAAVRAVGTNLADVSTTSQADLTAMASKAQFLSDTFGIDVTESTQAAANLISTGLAPNADAAFDIITTGLQNGADRSGDFIDTLTEYPAQFQKLGISGQYALSLITAGMKAGAQNSDKVADAIKEMAIRAVDGSKTTSDGFTSLGLNADATAAKFAAGGASAQGAMQQVLGALANVKDPLEKQRIGVELMGTQYEDLGPQVVDAMGKATPALDGLTGSTDKAMAAVGDNGVTKIESMKRAVSGWVISMTDLDGPLGDVGAGVAAFGPSVLGAAGSIGTLLVGLNGLNIASALTAVRTGIVTAATTAWSGAQWLLNAAMSANPIMLMVIAIAALVAGIVLAWQHSETFRDIVTGAFNAVWGVIQAVWGWIRDNWPLLLSILTGPIGIAVNQIRVHWDSIVGFARSAKDAIVGFFTGFAGTITAPFSAAFDGIKRAWNSTVGGKGFSVPGWIPGLGGKRFEIPRFAAGGIASGLSLINDQGGEIVNLPNGSRVMPSSMAQSAIGGGGPAMVVLEIQSSGDRMSDMLIELIRKSVKVKGGNVQLVLGSGS